MTIEYTKCENNTWKLCFRKLNSLYDIYACDEFRLGLDTLLSNRIYNKDTIPSLDDVNTFIGSRTGWTIKVSEHLVSIKDCITSFADKIFYCPQHVRNHMTPFHCTDTDIIHGLLGSIPMLLDEKFSNFLQRLGNLSLNACDQLMEKITKLYWYTIECGLCNSEYGVKIYGANILCNANELEHCMDNRNSCLRKQFDPNKFAIISDHTNSTFQNIYSYINNIDEMMQMVEHFIVINLDS